MPNEAKKKDPPEKKPMSAAQRRTRNKWDLKNMSTLACRIHRIDAERFRRYAEENGTNVNTLLANYALGCVGEKAREKSAAPAPKETGGREETAASAKEADVTLGCRLRREQAELFREYADLRGTTVSALLREYIGACIGEN